MSRVYAYAFSKAVSDRELDINEKTEIIKECIDAGSLFDINCNNSTELINAIGNLDYPLVKILLEFGIDVAAQDNAAIIMTSSHVVYLADILKLLISYGADPVTRNNEPICKATNINTVKFLIDLGADPFAQNNKLFKSACYRQDIFIIKFLFSIGINSTMFDAHVIWNIFKGNSSIELQKLFLDNGADPNAIYNGNGSFLDMAICSCNIDYCKLLLEYGTDVKLCNIKYKHQLNLSCYRNITGMQKIVDLIMEHGVDISHIMDWVKEPY
jgi:ankyrin repeat protein